MQTYKYNERSGRERRDSGPRGSGRVVLEAGGAEAEVEAAAGPSLQELHHQEEQVRPPPVPLRKSPRSHAESRRDCIGSPQNIEHAERDHHQLCVLPGKAAGVAEGGTVGEEPAELFAAEEQAELQEECDLHGVEDC